MSRRKVGLQYLHLQIRVYETGDALKDERGVKRKKMLSDISDCIIT